MLELRRDGLALEALRVLERARGPLTTQEVRLTICARHRGVVLYADVYNALRRLAKHGHAESRCDTTGGARCRIFWPTTTQGAEHGDHHG